MSNYFLRTAILALLTAVVVGVSVYFLTVSLPPEWQQLAPVIAPPIGVLIGVAVSIYWNKPTAVY